MVSESQLRKQFVLEAKGLSRKAKLTLTNGGQLSPNSSYSSTRSDWAPGKPDLTLMSGVEPYEVVAQVWMPAFSRNIKIGIGVGSESLTWEDMREESPWGNVYSVHMNLEGRHDNRRLLLWKRTSRIAAEGQRPGYSGYNWKLVDATEGLAKQCPVLAVFTKDSGITPSGILQLNVEWGSYFERMVIATLLSLYVQSCCEHGG
jgi:hypothetical protein